LTFLDQAHRCITAANNADTAQRPSLGQFQTSCKGHQRSSNTAASGQQIADALNTCGLMPIKVKSFHYFVSRYTLNTLFEADFFPTYCVTIPRMGFYMQCSKDLHV